MKCLNPGTLQAYLDSELPEIEMRDIAAHVEACVVCRGRLADLEATAQRVHAWLDALPSRDCDSDSTDSRSHTVAMDRRRGWFSIGGIGRVLPREQPSESRGPNESSAGTDLCTLRGRTRSGATARRSAPRCPSKKAAAFARSPCPARRQ